jgi:hypothetical protein
MQINYALVAIGELTHLAGQNGRHSDRMLALAASKVSGIAGLPETEATDPNGTYYHQKVLKTVCYPSAPK